MREVEAGEILQIKTGKYDANHAVDNGKYKFFTCALKPFMANTFAFDDEVIILPGNGANVGEVLYYKGKLEAYQRTYILHNIKENPKYLFYYFKKYWIRQITKRQVGSATNYIKIDDIISFKIPLPPLPEQKKIAAILDAADLYRRNTKALIENYDALTQSLFLDMFGDPVTNPKGWEVVLMSFACTKVTDGTHDTPERLTEGVKFITGKHIRPYTVDYDNSDYVEKTVHDEIFRRCNPALGDVLYTNIGVNLGTAALNKVEYEFSMKNVALLKPKSDLITGRYMEYFLNSKNMKKKIVWIGSLGGAQQFLSLTLLRRLKINIPPIDLQNQFAERVQAIEAQKAQAQEELEKAEDLFHSLLQRAFKGEIA